MGDLLLLSSLRGSFFPLRGSSRTRNFDSAAGRQKREDCPDLVYPEHGAHVVFADRGRRHRWLASLLGRLCDGKSALARDSDESLHAIDAAPGQKHADNAIPPGHRSRHHERVDGGPPPVHLRPSSESPALVLDRHVEVGRRQVHVSRLDRFPVARLSHRKLDVTSQNRGELASGGRTPMERDADGPGEIGGQMAQNTDQRLDAACRTAEREQITSEVLVIDQGTSPVASVSCVSSGRSASMMSRNRAACSRAMAPRRRWAPDCAGSSPSRWKSSSSIASSSSDENAIHSRRSSSSSLAARSSAQEYMCPTRQANVTRLPCVLSVSTPEQSGHAIPVKR